MAEKESGAISGAAQGAAAGAMVGGPVGAIVGGIIGGIGGLLGGGQAQKARKFANKAKKMERKISYLDAGIQRRDLIRQGRITRAESLAAIAADGEGAMQSSAPMGALSSYQAQSKFNLSYFDSRIQNYITMQRYVDKAGKYANKANNTMAITSSILSIGSSLYGMGRMSGLGDIPVSTKRMPIPSGGTAPSTFSGPVY